MQYNAPNRIMMFKSHPFGAVTQNRAPSKILSARLNSIRHSDSIDVETIITNKTSIYGLK